MPERQTVRLSKTKQKIQKKEIEIHFHVQHAMMLHLKTILKAWKTKSQIAHNASKLRTLDGCCCCIDMLGKTGGGVNSRSLKWLASLSTAGCDLDSSWRGGGGTISMSAPESSVSLLLSRIFLMASLNQLQHTCNMHTSAYIFFINKEFSPMNFQFYM